MDKFIEVSLPEKEDSYNNLWKILKIQLTIMQKRLCKDFEIKKLVECHDLYLKSNAFLLTDVFENFRKICLEFYEIDPAKFLSAPG